MIALSLAAGRDSPDHGIVTRHLAVVALGRRGDATIKGARAWQGAIFVVRVSDGEARRYEIPAGAPSPMGLAGGRRWWSLSPDGRRLALTLEEAP